LSSIKPTIIFDVSSLIRWIFFLCYSHILTDENLTELVKLSNEELDGSIKHYKERIDVTDSEIEHWQGRLERLLCTEEVRGSNPPSSTSPRSFFSLKTHTTGVSPL
jgi:hypothetical protein